MNLQTSYFIFYDLFIGFICIFILYRAYKKGLFAQIFGVLSFLASFIGACFLYTYLAQHISIVHQGLFSDALNQLLCFILSLIGLKLLLTLFYFMFKKRKGKKKTPLTIMNQIGGLVLGLIEVYVFIQCCFFFCSLPFVENGNQYKEESYIVKTEEKIIEEVKQLWNKNDSSFMTN